MFKPKKTLFQPPRSKQTIGAVGRQSPRSKQLIGAIGSKTPTGAIGSTHPTGANESKQSTGAVGLNSGGGDGKRFTLKEPLSLNSKQKLEEKKI